MSRNPVPMPCGCMPHVTYMRGMWGFYCETEDNAYCNFECPHEEAARVETMELWADVLDGPDEPDRATCVLAANSLVPALAFVNPRDYRDTLVGRLSRNPQMQHEARLLAILKVHEDETRAVDLGTVHPDAFDGVDCISWDAVPEVLCLAAVAALHNNKPSDETEAWVANGDAARDYLTEALDIDPDHNLARALLQQGDRLQHVSGGVA